MTRLRDRLATALAGPVIAARVQEAVQEVETRLRDQAEARVREALSAGMTRSDELLLQQGFRRLSTQGGAATRDLAPLAQDRMLAIAAWLWESNPLAQWLVEVVVDFVWGEGGTLEAPDARVAAVLERFWEDPVNRLELRMDDWVRELGLQGELCLPVAVNERDGHVRLGYVDPLEIDEVLTDPDNALVPVSVALKRVPGQPRRVLKVIREDSWRASQTYGLLMPAARGERDLLTAEVYAGSCFLFQVNKLSGARRGRSDLLSLIDWLDGYDALLFDQLDRGQLLDSFIWDVTLEGQTEEEIQAWLARNRSVRRGQIRAHNERVKWEAVAPDVRAQDKDTLLRLLRGHMLGARSIPEHYYGLGGDVNLATAKEMGLPTVKRMTRRQKAVRFLMRDLGRFAVHQAIVAGALPADVDQAVEVQLPEISVRDTTAITQALTSLTVALSQAETQGWIRKETAGRLFALLAGQLGMELDPAEETAQPGEPTADHLRDYGPGNVRDLRDRLEGR